MRKCIDFNRKRYFNNVLVLLFKTSIIAIVRVVYLNSLFNWHIFSVGMMYTRSKAQKEANLSDINWNIPGFKSSIIKTYSRKTPYVLVSATKRGVEEGLLPQNLV